MLKLRTIQRRGETYFILSVALTKDYLKTSKLLVHATKDGSVNEQFFIHTDEYEKAAVIELVIKG